MRCVQVAVTVEKEGFDGFACLYSMQVERLLPGTQCLVTHSWPTWCHMFNYSPLVPWWLYCLPFPHIWKLCAAPPRSTGWKVAVCHEAHRICLKKKDAWNERDCPCSFYGFLGQLLPAQLKSIRSSKPFASAVAKMFKAHFRKWCLKAYCCGRFSSSQVVSHAGNNLFLKVGTNQGP